MEEQFDVNKVTSEVIINLSTSMGKKCWEIMYKYCKDLKNKTEVDLGLVYLEYLDFSYSIVNQVKTILYRDNGRPLYSFYECIGLWFNGNSIDTSNIRNILELSNFIIITGTGGTGKTIMLKHFFLNCINTTHYVPVLINVRCANDFDISEKTITDIIYQEMKNYHFNLDKEYLEYSFQSGNYVFLFDGFDEVNEKNDKWLETEILSFCNRYPDNYYIMTSRPSERFVGWNNFIVLKALPLSKQQALSMVNKIDYDIIVKNEFYKALKVKLYDKYKSFASNPLLLTIMLITFENNAEIPEKLNDFYEQAFLTLFSKHDAYKNMYRREIKSNLGYTDFKKVFSCFCFLTYLKKRFELKEFEALDFIEKAKSIIDIHKDVDSTKYLDDLIHAVCMLIQDGFILSFSHRSFQEYFATIHIANLSDEDQVLLMGKMINNKNIETDSILNLLFEQQPERFIKNVLYPIMKEWRNTIEKKGYLEFLLTKFSGLSYSNYNYKRNKDSQFLGFRVSDDIYVSICDIMNKIIIAPDVDTVNRANIKKDLIEYFHKKNISYIEFENLKKTEIWEKVLQYMEYLINQIKNIMKYLKEYEKTKNTKKEKFDDLFE